jgi:hypothetical protein
LNPNLLDLVRRILLSGVWGAPQALSNKVALGAAALYTMYTNPLRERDWSRRRCTVQLNSSLLSYNPSRTGAWYDLRIA